MPAIPKEMPPVPDTLQWDLWVGPSVERPYHPSIAPYGWRFWWDYGTGETGNWGCHILDIPYWALGLKHPTRVDAHGPPVHEVTTPKSMHCTFQFPAEGQHGPITLHWYHGTPAILAEKKLKGGGNNLFIGTKGMLLCDFTKYTVHLDREGAEVATPKPSIPNSPGFHREWINACKGGEPATCHFDYTGPMTETVLLGNVAYRAGGFDWDASTLTPRGNDQAASLIRVPFRKGWELE
jgi:predicted dehydrogenase